MSVCSVNGIKGDRHVYKLNVANLSLALAICGNDMKFCKPICQAGMTMLSPSLHIEGDPDYLKGIFWNLSDMLGKAYTKTDREKNRDAAKIATDNQTTGTSSTSTASTASTPASTASTPASRLLSTHSSSEDESPRELQASNGIDMYDMKFVFTAEGYRITQFNNTLKLRGLPMSGIWTPEIQNAARELEINEAKK